MRIIRVSGCHDCEYPFYTELIKHNRCKKLTQLRIYDFIDKYIESKTLPDNCPLEKEKEFTMTDVHEAFGGVRK